MRYLRVDVLGECQCPSFLMLDCCHAGGFADGDDEYVMHDDALQHAIADIYLRQLTRHSALLACPRDVGTRERDDLRHGVFTHHLLRGLAGAAADLDGEVSFELLGTFIAGQRLHPPPVFIVHTVGASTTLTRPGIRSPMSGRPSAHQSSPGISVGPVLNPMEGSVGAITSVLDRAFRHGLWATGADRPSSRIELIRHAVDARSAAVLSYAAGTGEATHHTDDFRLDAHTSLLTGLFAHVSAAGTGRIGHIVEVEQGPRILAIPLSQDTSGNEQWLILVDPHEFVRHVGEPLATLLTSLWRLPNGDSLMAEFSALTAVREVYGRLPVSLYHYANQLYSQLINSLVMVFEPVMSLGEQAHEIGIYGWEALARQDENSRSAPVRLLAGAETWGDQFVIERDRVLGVRALHAYARAHNESVFEHNIPSPVSINVSVRSLLSDTYATAIGDAMREAGLGNRRVTLEISERDTIEPRADEVWLPSPVEFFQRRLADLARRLDVNFAVDDFGVGEASLDRLATLTLAHIKVDRAILHHPLALEEITLVARVASDAVDHGRAIADRYVVLEGFDEAAPVTLRDVYRCGVRYVQGYITGPPAATTLRPLDAELRTRIASLVAGTA